MLALMTAKNRALRDWAICVMLLAGAALIARTVVAFFVGPGRYVATDSANGVTVSALGRMVTVERSDTSTFGTAGAGAMVYCVDDYRKLLDSGDMQPSPDASFYAAGLLEWPQPGEGVEVELSHRLGKPDLCVAQSSHGSAVVYFNDEARHAVNASGRKL